MAASVQVVSELTPLQAAWGAYDRAAIELHILQREVRPETDTPFDARLRLEAGMQVLNLWRRFAELFDQATGGGPGNAA